MLSSGLRKMLKALLIRLAALESRPMQTQHLRFRLLASIPNALPSARESIIGRTVSAFRLKNFATGIAAVRIRQP